MKNTYEVTILQQKFVLRSENDEEHVQKVAAYVNQVLNDLQNRTQNVSTLNIAILGALNIAEHMMESEATTKRCVTDWKIRLENLVGQAF